MASDGSILRVAAVGSTVGVVEKSPARFCGVVTGRFSYSNSGGGSTHAVFAVGMFDLPENKAQSPASEGIKTTRVTGKPGETVEELKARVLREGKGPR